MRIYIGNIIKHSPVKTFNFPAGEVGVVLPKIDPINNSINVMADLKSSDSIMGLLLTVDALKRKHLGIKINAFIPYIPYGRQDRVINDGESFSIKIMANLINSMELNKIITLDTHSHVTDALINNLIVVEQYTLVPANTVLKTDVLIAPDVGAEKKIYKLAKEYNKPVVTASKRRDIDGKIISTEVSGDVNGLNCLIVDDICDGGATFTHLATELFNMGAKSVRLHVTHGLFTKGLKPLEAAGIEFSSAVSYMQFFEQRIKNYE